ncbi:MAG: hypothetical protein ACI4J4_08205, partial [Ruminiclostridium sp.]
GKQAAPPLQRRRESARTLKRARALPAGFSEIGGTSYLLLSRKSKLGGTAGVVEASRAAASAAARVCGGKAAAPSHHKKTRAVPNPVRLFFVIVIIRNT